MKVQLGRYAFDLTAFVEPSRLLCFRQLHWQSLPLLRMLTDWLPNHILIVSHIGRLLRNDRNRFSPMRNETDCFSIGQVFEKRKKLLLTSEKQTKLLLMGADL